jgi:hypothetical protein
VWGSEFTEKNRAQKEDAAEFAARLNVARRVVKPTKSRLLASRTRLFPSIPAEARPLQGRRRPTPRCSAAGARRFAPSPPAFRHTPSPRQGRRMPS